MSAGVAAPNQPRGTSFLLPEPSPMFPDLVCGLLRPSFPAPDAFLVERIIGGASQNQLGDFHK